MNATTTAPMITGSIVIHSRLVLVKRIEISRTTESTVTAAMVT